MWWVFPFCLLLCNAYRIEMSTLVSKPAGIDVSATCTMITYSNKTVLHFGHTTIETNRSAAVRSINANCDLVLFGYPSKNKVVMWYPNSMLEKTIEPNANVPVSRFGYSLDIQNNTWVVGAPGRPNNLYGENATAGFAFVYEDDQLHSCRSSYDTYCFPSDSTCLLGYTSMKNYYNVTDAMVPSFQKECRTSGTPVYQTGPLDRGIRADQQFGYKVALTGALKEPMAGLFVAAPGDTHRFMEDNRGQNVGQVYTWRNVQHNDITWWEMSASTPLKAPEIATVTYRAFGRSISATDNHLVVSSYPLYDVSTEPFVYVYDCVMQHCELSATRGITINDLPGNVLGYLGVAEMSYTTGKNWDYIPADVPGDQLDDFQNAFVGTQVAIAGSNLLIPDERHKNIYRLGLNNQLREAHAFDGQIGFDIDSEQFAHDIPHSPHLKHLYPCEPGHVGGASVCQPCAMRTFSTDGWLTECEYCPRNFTTNATGQTECIGLVRPSLPTLEWSETLLIMIMIVVAALALYGSFIVCECCESKERKKRPFLDTIQRV